MDNSDATGWLLFGIASAAAVAALIWFGVVIFDHPYAESAYSGILHQLFG